MRAALTFDRIGPLPARQVLGTLLELMLEDDEPAAWASVMAAFVGRARQRIRRPLSGVPAHSNA